MGRIKKKLDHNTEAVVRDMAEKARDISILLDRIEPIEAPYRWGLPAFLISEFIIACDDLIERGGI